MRERLLEFVDLLRGRGVRVSVAESIDAMNAVAAAGLGRTALREALAAALIKDQADRALFDELFGNFFRSGSEPRAIGAQPRPGEGLSAAAGRGRQEGGHRGEEQPSPREQPGREPRSVQRREQHAAEKESSAHETRADREGDLGESEAAREAAEAWAADTHSGRLQCQRATERKRFEDYSDLDYERAREALAPLARRFRIRLGRRLMLNRRGRVDLRRTIRASIQRGGALIDLRRRSRRPRHADLLLLADVSGSVHYASDLMLEIAAGAGRCFRRVRSFVFIDRLAEAEFERGHLVMTPALDLYARSDFGRVLAELWSRRAELIGRATLLVIMGDGRNNRRPPRADLLREITRLVRAVVWLNPEEPARWGTGDSAIHLYAREVRTMLPARNLAELARGLERVA